jgi:hypothetical protein
MKRSSKFALLVLLSTFLFNILAVGSTLVLHELGHYIAAEQVGCKNIKLVLLDSNIGTYTEMACPEEEPEYFAVSGALLLTTPFALAFLLLKALPEKNLFWIILGFNLTIIMMDVPEIIFLRALSFGIGIALFMIGEVLLIDNLFLYTESVEGMVGVKGLEDAEVSNQESMGIDALGAEIDIEERNGERKG